MCINLTVIDDSILEGIQRFSVILTSAVYVKLDNGASVISIMDNDSEFTSNILEKILFSRGAFISLLL